MTPSGGSGAASQTSLNRRRSSSPLNDGDCEAEMDSSVGVEAHATSNTDDAVTMNWRMTPTLQRIPNVCFGSKEDIRFVRRTIREATRPPVVPEAAKVPASPV